MTKMLLGVQYETGKACSQAFAFILTENPTVEVLHIQLLSCLCPVHR